DLCPALSSAPPPRAARWGLPLFCHHRFQRLDVQRLFGDDVFEPAILVLELLQPLHLAQLHAAVLRFPAVVRLLGDPRRATKVGALPAVFALLDDRQNLLVGVFAPFHRSSSARRTSSYPWRIRGGRSARLRDGRSRARSRLAYRPVSLPKRSQRFPLG